MEELLKLYITVFALIYVAGYFLPSRGVLFCGIFGGQAKPGRVLSIKKLASLGLYNISRGVDSCGYYFNGNIVKGVDDFSNFGVFIARNKLIRGNIECLDTFIGHTRKSTTGSNNEVNAHPHVIEDDYVQVHNGTLKYPWMLCTKHGVDSKNLYVDSQALAAIIYKERKFDIYNEYEGFAATASLSMKKPNTLYLYHGATKLYRSDKVLYEERPLFYLNTVEGIYFSSIEESLEFINESKTVKVQKLPHNMVYQINDGENLKNYQKITRDENNLSKVVSVIQTQDTYTPRHYDRYPDSRQEVDYSLRRIQKTIPFGNEGNKMGSSTGFANSLVLRECRPLMHTTQDVYYWMGRHFTRTCTLLHGMYVIDRDGMIQTESTTTTRTTGTYYFFRGVMLKDEASYQKVIDSPNTFSKVYNLSFLLSGLSKYPVACLHDEGQYAAETFLTKWYKDEVMVKELVFNPKFSKRKYRIFGGELVSIQATDKHDNSSLFNQHYDQHFKPIENSSYLSTQYAQKTDGKEIEVSFSEEVWEILKLTINEAASIRLRNKKAVDNLPEQLLLMIDYLNSMYVAKNNQTEIEEATVLTLSDMIKTNATYLEYLTDMNDEEFFTEKSIKEVFASYTDEEIMSMKNRYEGLTYEIVKENLDYEDIQDAEYEEIVDNSIGMDWHNNTQDQHNKIVEHETKLYEDEKLLKRMRNNHEALAESTTELGMELCRGVEFEMQELEHKILMKRKTINLLKTT